MFLCCQWLCLSLHILQTVAPLPLSCLINVLSEADVGRNSFGMKKTPKKQLPYLYVCLAAAFCYDPAAEKPALLPRRSRNGSIVGKITRRTSRVADVAASPEFSRWLPFIERTLPADDVSGFRTNQEVDALVEGPGSLGGGKRHVVGRCFSLGY